MHPLNQLPIPEGKIGIHWFGQNSFALKDASGFVVLTDPYFPLDRPAEKFIYRTPPLDGTSLKTDLVLLTHDHSDHTCIESLHRINGAHPEAKLVGPSESVDRMAGAGIPSGQLNTIAAGGSHTFGPVTIHAVWSKPPEGVPGEDIGAPRVQHLGYLIGIGGVRVYITGDLINTFADHPELMAPVAALKPDIGLVTMHPTEGEFPFFEGAVRMAVDLGLKAVVPAHYACFVKRTYDPVAFAKLLPEGGPEAVIIGYDRMVVHPA